jgi:sulfite reductase alpha subunit-like flavoprotein/nitric oxide synthase oxygenase domain/subunit
MSLSSVREVLYLNELTLRNHSERDDHQFRAQIVASDADARPTAEVRLGIRQQPHWLAGMRLDGHCRLIITVMARAAGEGNPWSTLGVAVIDTQDAVSDGMVTWVHHELPNAMDGGLPLVLAAQLYLTKEYGEGSRVHTLARDRPLAARAPELDLDDVELEYVEPLTPQEEVLVKDTWNKALDWKDMVMQLFVERMLVEAPELAEVLGDFGSDLSEQAFGLMDLAVRSLQPHTEVLAREAYKPVHPDPAREHDTVEAYAKLFAEIGLRRRHWVVARHVWMWAVGEVPYLRDYERSDLRRGPASAMWRFWTAVLMPPMFEAIDTVDELLSPDNVARLQRIWSHLHERKAEAGVALYRRLFELSPELLLGLGDPDVDKISRHLFKASQHLLDTIGTIIAGLDRFYELVPTLQALGRTYRDLSLPSDLYARVLAPLHELLRTYVPAYGQYDEDVLEAILGRVRRIVAQPSRREEHLVAEALAFVSTIAAELCWSEEALRKRASDIRLEIRATGTYTHTYEELVLGAQLAWRNSAKCIGRIQWSNMVVRDRREVTHPDAMFREVLEHLESATAGGNIQIVMTVFGARRPHERWGPRFWNQQLVRYACWEQDDGTRLGDPANLALTRAIVELGWEPPAERTAFDLLPLVIQVPGRAPRIYPVPSEAVLEVAIKHPTIPGIGALGLRWCAVPAISAFRLTLGGVDYTCAPFNGWFMGTEIARNLWERYDVGERVAAAIGLDTASEQTLWRDEAWLALNRAVLWSFQEARVSMVDHHTASQQFLAHDLREKRLGRECPAQWSWVVPPLGGSICPVWHHEMRDFVLEPQYHYQGDVWAVERAARLDVAQPGEESAGGWSQAVLVLYGSESGTAERYAHQLARRLQGFACEVLSLDDVDPRTLDADRLVLVVTSTYGDGKVPSNAERFVERLGALPPGSLGEVSYAVMGIGSSVYEHFCAGGVTVDALLAQAGARRLLPLHRGDEMDGQAASVRAWMELVARVLGERDDRRPRSGHAQLAVRWLEPHEPAPAVAAAASARMRRVALTLVDNQELLAEASPGLRSTRAITLDATGLPARYVAGDHLAVYPQNPSGRVERLCARLSIDPDARFEVLGGSSPVVGCTAREVLSRELSIGLQEPFEDLLEVMALRATDDVERHRLETMLEQLGYGEEHAAAVVEHLTACYVDLPGLLDDFRSVSLELPHLFELLPPLRPRLYSISSSPRLSADRVRLTVGVVEVTTSAGLRRPGLCSHYLAGLRPGATVQAELRRSEFRLPEDPRAPLVLVGPGTGISPLVGFLEERQALEAAGATLGPAWLWFGCRTHADYLYRERLEGWLESGVLTDLDVAFSRLGDHKVYVQHLMHGRAEALWEMLSAPDCHVCICGDAKMGDDVLEAFVAIAMDVGRLPRDAAMAMFAAMKRQRRYQADVWGVTLHVAATTEAMRESSPERTGRLLERSRPPSRPTAAAVPVS